MGCYADPYNIPTHLIEILNSTHFKDYYSKPSTCYGNLILTLTGRKKSITPPPFGKIAAPIFKSPKIFRRHRFYIGDPKIGRPGGAPGKHPFFARTCNCIHGRDRWDPCAPLLRFSGVYRGGLEEAFLFPGGLRNRPECLLFAPQHSPIAAPAIKLSRVRVYDQG